MEPAEAQEKRQEASEAPSPGGGSKLSELKTATKKKKQRKAESPVKKASKVASKKKSTQGRLAAAAIGSDSDSDADDDIFVSAKAKPEPSAANSSANLPEASANGLDEDGDETMEDGDISALKAKFSGPVPASEIVQDAPDASADGNSSSYQTIIRLLRQRCRTCFSSAPPSF